eukprot:4191271-Prymnesium_polylepis.1
MANTRYTGRSPSLRTGWLRASSLCRRTRASVRSFSLKLTQKDPSVNAFSRQGSPAPPKHLARRERSHPSG